MKQTLLLLLILSLMSSSSSSPSSHNFYVKRLRDRELWYLSRGETVGWQSWRWTTVSVSSEATVSSNISGSWHLFLTQQLFQKPAETYILPLVPTQHEGPFACCHLLLIFSVWAFLPVWRCFLGFHLRALGKMLLFSSSVNCGQRPLADLEPSPCTRWTPASFSGIFSW